MAHDPKSRRSPRARLSMVAWLLVAVLGAAALGVCAFARGEPVNAWWVMTASLCVFALAYRFHSAWLLAEVLTIDDLRATPAVAHEDGRDFV